MREKLGREQGGLIAASARPDLDDYALVIIRISWQQQLTRRLDAVGAGHLQPAQLGPGIVEIRSFKARFRQLRVQRDIAVNLAHHIGEARQDPDLGLFSTIGA